MKAKGAGSLYRRGSIWWVRYGFRGRDLRESSGSPHQTKARQLLKRRLGEIGRGQFIGADEDKVLMADLLDAVVTDYEINARRSLVTLRGQLAHVRAVFGLDRARDVTTARIEEYKRGRLAEQAAPATLNRELAALRRAFRLGVKQQRISQSPEITLLVERNARQGFVDPGDFEVIVANLPDEAVRDFARFGFATGWRKQEIATLTWADVDREAGRIELRREHSKNWEPRVLPLTGDLATLIERRWAARAVPTNEGSTALSQWVFHRTGRPVANFRKSWRTACKAANRPGVLFHDLRRSAIRNMEQAGVSQSVAMKISGHKTDAIYRRYRIVDERDLANALTRTQQHVASQPTGTVSPIRPARDGSR